jgi:hypothetical protein
MPTIDAPEDMIADFFAQSFFSLIADRSSLIDLAWPRSISDQRPATSDHTL